MIYDYEIKNLRNEEVLCLYFDFTLEFAKLGKNSKKTLEKEINSYIKNNKIKFNGKKILISIGGIVVATLLINKPVLKLDEYEQIQDNYTISLVDKTLINDLQKEIDEKNIESEQEQQINDIVNNTDTKTQINNNTSNVTTNKKSSSKKNTIKKEEAIVIPDVVCDAPKQEDAKIDVENQIIVNVKRSNGEIINLELEEYIIGVVGAEMPASFHVNALKAQAVIARTYAMKAIKTGKVLTDNSSTQNYKSNDELRKTWGNSFNTYYEKIKSAVMDTKGIYLTYNGDIIEAPYHSTSNGYTEDAQYVWGNSFPYLVSVKSEYDTINSSFLKTLFIDFNEISNRLGFSVNNQSTLNILSTTSSGRIEKIDIDGNILTGVVLRNKLGLRSTDVTFEILDDGINFTTRGYGHGVGMSQYGANGMAKNGYSYDAIITHYYPGVSLTKSI